MDLWHFKVHVNGKMCFFLKNFKMGTKFKRKLIAK